LPYKYIARKKDDQNVNTCAARTKVCSGADGNTIFIPERLIQNSIFDSHSEWNMTMQKFLLVQEEGVENFVCSPSVILSKKKVLIEL
jgi:hypothetical protein